MFKHLKKRSSEALPNLLQPLTPINLANLANVSDDKAVDSVINSMEQMDVTEEWSF